MKKGQMKKPIKAFLLFILILSLLLSMIACKEKPDVNIRFFEGDSVVITTQRKAVLIDPCESDAQRIKEYLIASNIEVIETAVLSELNESLLLGVAEITKEIDAANFYIPAHAYNGAGYEEFMTVCDELAVEPYIVDGSVSFGVGDTSVRVYAPVDNTKGSLITRVVCNKRSMLFCANADNDRIKEFSEYDKNEYDLIKMPKNGENFDSLTNLIKTAKPDIAVITFDSSGQKKLLEENKCDVYILEKEIEFNCNGRKIIKN